MRAMAGILAGLRLGLGAIVLAGVVMGARVDALAQEITLKIHHFLPADAVVPKDFISVWAETVETASQGRLKFEIYPDMQLGGQPPSLIDQLGEGVADIVWTLPSYSPGRFPKAEAFEMPFLPASAEATSRAAWEFYEKHLKDEFQDVKILAVHVHGPGLIHMNTTGIAKLEDMQGRKLRGPTRMVNKLLEKLGAVPVGMPISVLPEALAKGTVEGAVAPWEVTRPLQLVDLANVHTEFSGGRGLYTAVFVLAMSKASYDALPDDLKAIIDANSGLETSATIGRVMDEGDRDAKAIAADEGNKIITLNPAETERWTTVSKAVIADWIAEMRERGIDGAHLYQDA